MDHLEMWAYNISIEDPDFFDVYILFQGWTAS